MPRLRRHPPGGDGATAGGGPPLPPVERDLGLLFLLFLLLLLFLVVLVVLVVLGFECVCTHGGLLRRTGACRRWLSDDSDGPVDARGRLDSLWRRSDEPDPARGARTRPSSVGHGDQNARRLARPQRK
jgi:hypothetical protein